MASCERRPNSICWLAIILILLASKASSDNTTENATTVLSSLASPSESQSSFISNFDSTLVSLPTASPSSSSEFSTTESRDLDSSKGVTTSVVISPNTAEITPSESNTLENPSSYLIETINVTETFISSEMTSPFSQPGASSDFYSNSKQIKSTMVILESFSVHPLSASPDGMVSNTTVTSRIIPLISTDDHFTKTIMEPPNASVTASPVYPTFSVSSTDAKSVFEDLTSTSLMATASEYSGFSTSTMTSEDSGYSSPKPNSVISSSLQDSSSTDMISKTTKTSPGSLLFPSITSHISSAFSSSSVQHSSSASERESLLTEILEKTIDTTVVATQSTVLQPSRTAEPPMSATVTLNDTFDADRLRDELSRLQKNIDDLEDEINGWKIALAILATCLGLILLVVIIRLTIKCRQRDKPAKMNSGGVDDITRKEVLDMRQDGNKSFFRRPGSSTFLDKGLNRISSIFNKRSSNSHELETFGGTHPPVPSVMEEVDETEVAGGGADVQMTQFRSNGGKSSGEPKLNGDGQEIRNSFTEVDLH